MHPPRVRRPLPVAPLLRDLARGLQQQMFLWGLDADHPSGNLLVTHGFERRPSTGLRGTSCYRRSWESGAIELHGSHAGFQGRDEGAYFIRPLERCARWLAPTPPIPGAWDRHLLDRKPSAELLDALRSLVTWWLEHDRRVADQLGPGWRQRGFERYRSLPKARAWLAPEPARRWLESLLRDPASTPRARFFSASARPSRPR